MQEYKNDKLVVRYDPAICIGSDDTIQGCLHANRDWSRDPDRLQWPVSFLCSGILRRNRTYRA